MQELNKLRIQALIVNAMSIRGIFVLKINL